MHSVQERSGALFLTNNGSGDGSVAGESLDNDEPLAPLETLTSKEFLVEMVMRMDDPPLDWRPTPDEMTRFIKVATDPSIIDTLDLLERRAVGQVVEGFAAWLNEKPSEKPPAAS